VDWPTFVESLRTVVPFERSGTLPREPGWFDEQQLQQVVLNLLKNSHEAGSAPGDTRLSVAPDRGGVMLELANRGTGMSEVLAHALLPSTDEGQRHGLGSPLPRDRRSSAGRWGNRPGGGVVVRVWLPPRFDGVLTSADSAWNFADDGRGRRYRQHADEIYARSNGSSRLT
jgi:hypothetical protein